MIRLKSLLKEAIVKIDKEFNDELIDRINDEYNEDYQSLTPKQINDGYCDMWASLFVEKFGGKHYWSFDFPTAACGHSWVKLGNKFYDSEVPNGVLSLEQLPFVQRAIKQYGKDWLTDTFYDGIQS